MHRDLKSLQIGLAVDAAQHRELCGHYGRLAVMYRGFVIASVYEKQAAEQEAWAEQATRQREHLEAMQSALVAAFPVLCENLASQLDSEARWVGRGWPDGGEVVPGSIDPERAAPIRREVAVVEAVAAALGVELPEDLADLLPALPASNDPEAAS